MSLRRIWNNLFKRHLLLTNTVSCGILLGVGDAIQQGIEFKRGVNFTEKYDWKRTCRLFVVGLISGPPHHYFYIWLDKCFPKNDFKGITRKIIIDQLVAGPFFAALFFGGVGLLEGKSSTQCVAEFKQKFIFVYLFDWCIWPPTQAINFYFVPKPYRVLYVNFVTVIWDVFLSYMKHFDQEEQKKTEKEL